MPESVAAPRQCFQQQFPWPKARVANLAAVLGLIEDRIRIMLDDLKNGRCSSLIRRSSTAAAHKSKKPAYMGRRG